MPWQRENLCPKDEAGSRGGRVAAKDFLAIRESLDLILSIVGQLMQDFQIVLK